MNGLIKKQLIILLLLLIPVLVFSACGETSSSGDGVDGNAPYIGQDGYWHIGEINTYVRAAGEDGAAGRDGYSPYIGEDGHWYLGDRDTGIVAEARDGKDGSNGITPHIGDNGHWYIGENDTGVIAEGRDGENGSDGVTPRIGDNGHWYIGDVDTGIFAKGQDGKNGDKGKDGSNGVTPHIGDNGNWYIGDTDTGIAAAGKDGTQLTVGNNGHWYVDGVDSGVVARGIDGADGKSLDIRDIYDVAVANGYEGTMLQFLKEYLTVTDSGNDVRTISECLLSSVRIISRFVYSDAYITSHPLTIDPNYGASGSGVIYTINHETGDALIITNYHVIYDVNSNTETHISDDISVYLYGSEVENRKMQATFVGGSMTYDLALLRISGDENIQKSIARPAVFANSDLVRPGQTVYAIGNGGGDGIVPTKGIVNIDSEYLTMQYVDESGDVDYRELRIDAAVNPGNSGGGVFDTDGRLLGIVNAKSIESKTDNVGYAIPATLVRRVVESILYYSSEQGITYIKKSLMGIKIQVFDSYPVYDEVSGTIEVKNSIKVAEIGDSSALKGLLEADDVITSVQKGERMIEVSRLYHITELMLECHVGDTLGFYYLRGDAKTPEVCEINITEEMIINVK